MSKKKHKKEGNERINRTAMSVNKEDIYDDLPDGLLEAVEDEELANVYVAWYITLFAFFITVLIVLFVFVSQYKMLAELLKLFYETTAVHVPNGADIESFSGTIKTW